MRRIDLFPDRIKLRGRAYPTRATRRLRGERREASIVGITHSTAYRINIARLISNNPSMGLKQLL
jgi:hypothetical protein